MLSKLNLLCTVMGTMESGKGLESGIIYTQGTHKDCPGVYLPNVLSLQLSLSERKSSVRCIRLQETRWQLDGPTEQGGQGHFHLSLVMFSIALSFLRPKNRRYASTIEIFFFFKWQQSPNYTFTDQPKPSPSLERIHTIRS